MNLNEKHLKSITDEELAEMFRSTREWILELCNELVRRADVKQDGVWEEYEDAENDEDFGGVVVRASEILGVDIF